MVVGRMGLMISAVACLSALAVGTVAAQDRGAPDAAQKAQVQSALAKAAIAANRTAAIDSIVAKWQGSMPSGESADTLAASLKGVSNSALAKIKGAGSWQEVVGILLGKVQSSTSEGGAVIQNLGDVGRDLVYTPVDPPCRIVDTRFDTDGATIPAAGSIKHWYAHGPAGVIAPQGGNAAGCTAPQGEAVGGSVNLAAVSPTANSHLRIYPYLGVLPTVSYVNYTAGQNIANAGIITFCYFCGQEFSVYTGVASHYIADIMGYFYPVQSSDPALNQVKETAWNSGFGSGMGANTIYEFATVTTSHWIDTGDEVHIVANKYIGSSVGANSMHLAPCYKLSTATNPTVFGGVMLGGQVPAGTRVSWGVSGVAKSLAPGLYEFGMCYNTSNANWNSNEYGYVSTVVVNPWP